MIRPPVGVRSREGPADFAGRETMTDSIGVHLDTFGLYIERKLFRLWIMGRAPWIIGILRARVVVGAVVGTVR